MFIKNVRGPELDAGNIEMMEPWSLPSGCPQPRRRYRQVDTISNAVNTMLAYIYTYISHTGNTQRTRNYLGRAKNLSLVRRCLKCTMNKYEFDKLTKGRAFKSQMSSEVGKARAFSECKPDLESEGGTEEQQLS